MDIKTHIFREYDIRGIVDEDLSPEFAYLLGRAYGSLAKDNNKNNIGIGYDMRLSSKPYTDSLARGIADEGLDVVVTGLGPSPQLYWALFNKNLGGGIQVTGSHNPQNMNGFKICLGQDSLSGKQILDLKDRIFDIIDNDKPCSPNPGQIIEEDIREEYTNYLIDNCKDFFGKRKLKIVVDAGNGVGGLVGPNVLRGLGAEVIELFCEPDGNFPNHHPDPTVMENSVDLIEKVKTEKADLGIAWDGDGDRIGVVDENGEVIFGDMLVLIYARSILAQEPGATIIADVKCSSLLFDGIEKAGGQAIMWKTGHSLVKAKLKETGGLLAGEMSGHIFFKHRYFGYDDAMYCSARIAEILSHTNKAFSSLLSDLPKTYSTPEIRRDCPEEVKFEIAERAQKAFSDFTVKTIDGVRVEFENGWGLVRASNTQPVLVLRFEATSKEDLNRYEQIVNQKIAEIEMELTSN